jgi:hypothetical protein
MATRIRECDEPLLLTCVLTEKISSFSPDPVFPKFPVEIFRS